MKNQILKLIQEKPKHFSIIIKNNPEMWNWVLENTLVISTIISDIIYSALHQTDGQCKNGKKKKFLSINFGYIGCGKAATCECVRSDTATSVTISKSKITPVEQEIINDKRRITNLEKYGVTCAGQTEKAKMKHKNFYADPIKVSTMLSQIKETYQQKYGVDNCRQLPEVEAKRLATLLTKYNVTNISQIPSTKGKLQARIAAYKLNGHLLEKGYDRFNAYLEEKYKFHILDTVEEYKQKRINKNNEFFMQCNICQTSTLQKFNYGRGITCQKCNPKIKTWLSKEEQEVYDFITKDLGIAAGHQSDRKLINPFELDMVFPEQKIAIEYCGLYWHSELSLDKNRAYHFNKMNLTNEKGYQLITIFSDEWKLKPEIVKSRLRNIFKKTSTRYFARKMIIKEVSQKESKIFLNQHHIQGHGTAKINAGLFDPKTNNLVALMTFSNGRAALNSKFVYGEFELVRFVTDGSTVVGGASRLLKYFIKTYNPSKIISYADLRWSEGNLYKTIGFAELSKPIIGYWYVEKYEKRAHRFNFTKQTLVNEGADPNMTEWEIMQELGYDRIWDCGHQKYIMQF